ncbi:MAG: hypothetical protein V4550_06545 [Gemmatimonadota bacterium]
MLHLHTERLAALSDEPATPEEAAHLASCDVCALELHAYESLLAMAASERDSFGLPLTRWDAISAALQTEPLVVSAPAQVRAPNRRMLQIAAGLLLVAGGAILGRVSAGANALPDGNASLASTSSGVTRTNSIPTDSIAFRTLDEARMAQQRSEAIYQQSTAFLARYDTSGAVVGSPVAYRSRLAALDQMLNTTREAMRDVPHDPVINGYYLTTLGQREATLRQINTALPASLRVNSF